MEWFFRGVEEPPEGEEEILVAYEYRGKLGDFSVVSWDAGHKEWVGRCDGELSIQSQGDFGTDYHTPYFTHWCYIKQ